MHIMTFSVPLNFTQIISGQCGAIRLGISRALLNFSDSYWKPLDEGKCSLYKIHVIFVIFDYE